MKYLLSLFLLISILFSAAAQVTISDFEMLMKSLNSGGEVRAVFDYSKCDLMIDGKKSDYVPNAIGGMSVDVYEYFAKGAVRNDRAYVVFSENKLIENPIGDGFVYNYAKVRVHEDGEVIIYVKYLDPLDFSVKMSESFHTVIRNEKNDAGASFFTGKK